MTFEEFTLALANATPDKPAPETIAKPSPHIEMTAWFKRVYCDYHGRLWRDDDTHITLIYDPRWQVRTDPV